MSHQFFTVILAASVLAGVSVLAVSPSVTNCPVASADGEDGDEPLEKAMEKLNRGFRDLRKAGSDYAKVLELATSMQQGAMMAKTETPETVSELDVKKQPMALKKFRLTMISLCEELLALEKAALNENAGQIKASVQKLRNIQQSGHKEFKGEDEEEGEKKGGKRGGRGGRGE